MSGNKYKKKIERARERIKKGLGSESALEAMKRYAIGAAIGEGLMHLGSGLLSKTEFQLEIPPCEHALDLCREIEEALKRSPSEISARTRADIAELIGLARSPIHFPDCLR